MTPKYENKKLKQGYTHIIGCDEVGRGCLAGPVVAAAVIMKCETWSMKRQIKDSKLLSPEKREELSDIIKQRALWGIGVVDEKMIDEINIHHASLLAMKRAIDSLRTVIPNAPEESLYLFVDGKFPVTNINIEQLAVVDGDNKVLSIAAASIVAKVYRDDLMRNLHSQYPLYNFAQHKGYATFHHRKMITEHGLSKIHRLTFCSNLS